MKWKIIADSGSTVTELTTKNENIEYYNVPLMINLGTDVYIDDDQLDLGQFRNEMKANQSISGSACPSPNAYQSAFEGADNIICFTISSGLSGSYNSALIGKNLALENNPNLNIHVVDTLSAGAGMNVIVHKVVDFIEQGHSFDEVVQKIEDYKLHTDIVFILEQVDNLVKNGRMSKLVGGMIGLLGIRLIGVATPDGKLDVVAKSKGTKRAVKSLISEMMSRGYKGGKIYITHYNNDEAVALISEGIHSEFPDAIIEISPINGLVSFYAQEGGLLLGYEK